jgi:hypothetical protein
MTMLHVQFAVSLLHIPCPCCISMSMSTLYAWIHAACYIHGGWTDGDADTDTNTVTVMVVKHEHELEHGHGHKKGHGHGHGRMEEIILKRI